MLALFIRWSAEAKGYSQRSQKLRPMKLGACGSPWTTDTGCHCGCSAGGVVMRVLSHARHGGSTVWSTCRPAWRPTFLRSGLFGAALPQVFGFVSLAVLAAGLAPAFGRSALRLLPASVPSAPYLPCGVSACGVTSDRSVLAASGFLRLAANGPVGFIAEGPQRSVEAAGHSSCLGVCLDVQLLTSCPPTGFFSSRNLARTRRCSRLRFFHHGYAGINDRLAGAATAAAGPANAVHIVFGIGDGTSKVYRTMADRRPSKAPWPPTSEATRKRRSPMRNPSEVLVRWLGPDRRDCAAFY